MTVPNKSTKESNKKNLKSSSKMTKFYTLCNIFNYFYKIVFIFSKFCVKIFGFLNFFNY